jgi:predicted DNA-binding protein YlxM (UPF0122 family)
MTVSITKLYEIISSKRGKEEAEAITSYVEEKIAEEFTRQKSAIVNEIGLTIERLRTDMEKLRTEMHQNNRNQMWAMIALFIPLYITMTIALINLLKH